MPPRPRQGAPRVRRPRRISRSLIPLVVLIALVVELTEAVVAAESRATNVAVVLVAVLVATSARPQTVNPGAVPHGRCAELAARAELRVVGGQRGLVIVVAGRHHFGERQVDLTVVADV